MAETDFEGDAIAYLEEAVSLLQAAQIFGATADPEHVLDALLSAADCVLTASPRPEHGRMRQAIDDWLSGERGPADGEATASSGARTVTPAAVDELLRDLGATNAPPAELLSQCDDEVLGHA